MPPAFLTQRPRVRWRPSERRPLVRAELRQECPALAEDLAALDDILLPTFYELDEEALRAQNSFRLGQVLIIVGGSAVTALGAVQAALGGGVTELGVVAAIASGALAAVVSYVRGRDAQTDYFTTRLKAERLRGEYFLYLGHVAHYDLDDAGERRSRLREQLEVIESERPA